MSFFKKLFSSGEKKEEKQTSNETNFKGVYSETAFNKRYTEENLNENPVILDGCLKMVESYFLEYKLPKKVEKPGNHPANLDQTIQEGIGFEMYCSMFNFEESQATMFLAYAFSDFLINKYGFKLYKDSEPELPLRSMTLKYNRNGVVVSLYPFEYASKVLNHEATFEDLFAKIDGHLETLPSTDELLKKMTDNQ
jgi:hypothetical protein